MSKNSERKWFYDSFGNGAVLSVTKEEFNKHKYIWCEDRTSGSLYGFFIKKNELDESTVLQAVMELDDYGD